MANGITLNWKQVVCICFTIGLSVYGTLVKADDKQEEAIKAIAAVASSKLDKTDFNKYTADHQAANEKLLIRFETEFKSMKKQVVDSEKEIIRIIERQRYNTGG
jgi:hypothetical protein